MAIPTEYSGLQLAIRFFANIVYRAQRTRVHIHGETGDVTSGEDGAKRRLPTVPDWEITITKASFDAANNPFDPPMNFVWGAYILGIQIFPGGVLNPNVANFVNGLLDDIELDQDANMLQPLTLHMVCANGINPSLEGWYPT